MKNHHVKSMFAGLALLWGSLLNTPLLAAENPAPSPSAAEQVIPITMANLRGQKALYDEGWFIITSTDETFRYAREKSIDSSGQALARTLTELQRHTQDLGTEVKSGVNDGLATGSKVFTGGTALSGMIIGGTHSLARWQLDVAQEGFVKAWDGFLLGNMTLVQRTEEDRAALRAIPGDYFSRMQSDFSNLYELSEKAAAAVTPDIEVNWASGFARAEQAFVEEYELSGEASNALTGLFDIMAGYGKAIYFALLEPGGKAAVKGVTVTASLAGRAVFLPTAGLLVITGRTVQSAGLSLYYTTTSGIKLVSPTIESGLLAGVSLLSAGTVPVTYSVGASAGLVNQVAVTTAAPLAATLQAGTTAAIETAKYTGLVTYDLLVGGSKVILNQAASGVALGYNALTALPAQLLLGSANAAFFLVYDGPRLFIARVSGKLDSSSAETPYHVSDIPVGTVLDLKQLQAVPGIEVEKVSEDAELIEKVLQQMPEDLRR